MLVLVGLLVGLFVGVEFAHYSLGGVCPKAPCVSGAELTTVTNRDYGPAVLELIKSAKESIHITSLELKYYENYKDSSVNEVVRELVAAHNRGVDVKILIDEYSKENNAYDLLKAAGVNVRWDDNRTTTHAKLVIIDGKTVLLGSTNFSHYSLEKNHEANIIIRDKKTAEQFEEYFKSLWDI